MRYPRCKRPGRTTWYAVGNEAAACLGGCAMADPRARRMFERLLRREAKRHRCSVASFSVAGNGFRIAVRFPRTRKLKRARLRRAAKRFYKARRRPPWLKWDDRQWEEFNRRLFDLSSMMGSLDGDYAQQYNKVFGREGHFWKDRFWSTLCADMSGVPEIVLLAEIKPVALGLARRPEQWEGGSARLRRLRRGRWLTPLGEIFTEGKGDPYARYRAQLQRRVPNLAAPVEEDAFEGAPAQAGRRGNYCAVLGVYLEQGVVFGTARQVQPWLDWLRSLRYYECRAAPAVVPGTDPALHGVGQGEPWTVLREPTSR